MAKDELGEAIAGIALGILGGIALAEILDRLLGKKCPKCGNSINQNQVIADNSGNWYRITIVHGVSSSPESVSGSSTEAISQTSGVETTQSESSDVAPIISGGTPFGIGIFEFFAIIVGVILIRKCKPIS